MPHDATCIMLTEPLVAAPIYSFPICIQSCILNERLLNQHIPAFLTLKKRFPVLTHLEGDLIVHDYPTESNLYPHGYIVSFPSQHVLLGSGKSIPRGSIIEYLSKEQMVCMRDAQLDIVHG